VKVRLAWVAFGALAACGSSAGPPPPQASTLRVLHAILSGPPLTVILDGRSVKTGLTFGQITQALTLASGTHTLEPRPPQDTTRRVLLVFNTTENVNYTALVVDSVVVDTVIIDPVLVPDTGSQPAAGHGRLRLANFAALAGAIDAYRTQPDSSGLLLTQQPFNYRAITHYFDGTAGKWTVVISHGGATDTLLATDSIAVGDGHARTVAIIDSTGGRVSWRVVTDR
jgi:uncharacterized protein DUF4397